MANQNALTAAHSRYLLVLLRLTAANGHTRCVDLAAALGRNGKAYIEQHFQWDVIDRKLLNIVELVTTTNRRRERI